MLSQHEVTAAIGSTAYGDGGDKLGTVDHFFVDDRTGEPTWVAVTTGLFGTRHSIVPAREASWEDGRLRLPVTAAAVTSAPAVEGPHLDPDEEAELRRHYGLGGELAGTAPADRHQERDAAGTADAGTAQPTPGAMTRSEERLQIGTEQVAARKVRLVKYVVTEEVQVTVPIRREEFRLEEVPLEGAGTTGTGTTGTGTTGTGTAGRAGDEDSLVPEGSATTGLPDEIILHAERPVFSVEVVPVERVRLRTEMVEGQETVTEQVLREQITVDQDDASRGAPRT